MDLVCISVVTLLALIGGINIQHYFIKLFNPYLTHLINLNHKPIYYLLKAILLFVCSGLIFYLMIKFNILSEHQSFY